MSDLLKSINERSDKTNKIIALRKQKLTKFLTNKLLSSNSSIQNVLQPNEPVQYENHFWQLALEYSEQGREFAEFTEDISKEIEENLASQQKEILIFFIRILDFVGDQNFFKSLMELYFFKLFNTLRYDDLSDSLYFLHMNAVRYCELFPTSTLLHDSFFIGWVCEQIGKKETFDLLFIILLYNLRALLPEENIFVNRKAIDCIIDFTKSTNKSKANMGLCVLAVLAYNSDNREFINYSVELALNRIDDLREGIVEFFTVVSCSEKFDTYWVNADVVDCFSGINYEDFNACHHFCIFFNNVYPKHKKEKFEADSKELNMLIRIWQEHTTELVNLQAWGNLLSSLLDKEIRPNALDELLISVLFKLSDRNLDDEFLSYLYTAFRVRVLKKGMEIETESLIDKAVDIIAEKMLYVQLSIFDQFIVTRFKCSERLIGRLSDKLEIIKEGTVPMIIEGMLIKVEKSLQEMMEDECIRLD